MNEDWRNELITKGMAFKKVEEKMKSLLKYFGYDNYEQADEKTQLAYDGMMDALTAIYDTPPTAQPEIIRCRDCKYMQKDEIFHQYWCNGNEVKEDHFCGYAERRKE